MRSYHHITLNTGNVAMQAHPGPDYAALAVLRPILEAGGGGVPGFPQWAMTFERTPDGGGTLFDVSRPMFGGGQPVVRCASCWSDAAAAATWATIAGRYRADWTALSVFGLRDASSRPPATPWLAVYMAPGIMSVVDPSSMLFLGDLEKSVAWTADEMFHTSA